MSLGIVLKRGKCLKMPFILTIKVYGDRYLYQKFAQLILIKDLDRVSERGKRTVYQGLKTSEGKRLLSSFVFGKISSAKDFIKNKL